MIEGLGFRVCDWSLCLTLDPGSNPSSRLGAYNLPKILNPRDSNNRGDLDGRDGRFRSLSRVPCYNYSILGPPNPILISKAPIL